MAGKTKKSSRAKKDRGSVKTCLSLNLSYRGLKVCLQVLLGGIFGPCSEVPAAKAIVSR